MAEAVATYWVRGTAATLHAHPWHYYVDLLLGFEFAFTEVFLLVLAVIGLILPSKNRAVLFLKYFAVLVSVAYSSIRYKTPWCVLTIEFALALLAGIAAAVAIQRYRGLALPLLAVGITHLAVQSWRASTILSSDVRNQWVYAQTGPEVYRIRDRVKQFASSSTDGGEVRIAVWSEENLWPLPWYLRDYPNVRWSRAVPTDAPAPPIILASPAMEPAILRKLYQLAPPGQRELYLPMFRDTVELRLRVEVRGYVAKSLAERCGCVW